MGKILVMDHSLANKIAAGEVVERPSSIVKELIENAIDASATKIDIILENSGINLIRVIDNGSGMDEADAYLAFDRHATSKLTNEQDLFRIMTLGFRGEAIPSIAAVSDMTLNTSDGIQSGTMVHVRGGKIITSGPAPLRKGTEITVKSLFFNTPARLKYLKSEYTELSYIIDFVNKIAIANPHIAIKLTNNQRLLLETFGNNNLIHVLASIYGTDIAKKINTVNYKDHYLNLTIYYSEPDVNRTTRNYLTIIVNKRMIKNYELTKAILDGYDTYLPIKRYPIVVLAIEVDPLLVDVNVHPAKLEVRLSNEAHIKTVITDTIQKNLRNLMYVPQVAFRKETESNESVNEMQQEFDFTSFQAEKSDVSQSIKNENNNAELKQSNKIYQKLPKLYYIGQLKGTYLLAQNESGLYMIDQHAAEERVNYEFYLKHFFKNINEYYELLIPLTFEFSVNEALIIEDNLALLSDMHFKVEKFGLNSFIVHKIPNFFNFGNEKVILETIFDHLINAKKIDQKTLFNDLAAKLSCKRSIKANHYINENEIEKLLQQLEKCDNPYTCPHGRPVIIHISFKEIEHLFKRTM